MERDHAVPGLVSTARSSCDRRRCLEGGSDSMSTDLTEGVMTPELNPLTLREAAELLGLHPRAVCEYVRRGELIGYVVGKRWQFRQEDITTFLSAGRGWDFDRSVDGEE